MDEHDSPPLIPDYPVRWGEVLLIALGAIAVMGAGLAGLGMKAIGNAFDPERAEAIATSLIDYEIPGGARGIFGIKIGGAKVAWVRSVATPPHVVLFVGKTPINKETGEAEQRNPIQDFENPPSDQAEDVFTPATSRIEFKIFCGQTVPVIVQVGEQTFTNLPNPLPAVRYIVNTKAGSESEWTVILTANGKAAPDNAAQVFNSLRCK
jgi:hypothetical protein